MKRRSVKKTVITIIIFIIFLILLFPIPEFLKDGGTVRYNAILYTVTKEHSLAKDNGYYGYYIGTRVRILFFEVYDDVEFVADEE